MSENKIPLQVYIDNLNAGVSDEDILRAAIEDGVLEKTAKSNLTKAKNKIAAGEDNAGSNSNNEENKEPEEVTMKSKAEELLSLLDSTFETGTDLRELRRQSKLSDTGIANVCREITQLKKVVLRYVEN